MLEKVNIDASGMPIEENKPVSISTRLAAITNKFSGELYHGTSITGLTELLSDMKDYLGCGTLGTFVYYTDDRETGCNYALYRSNERGGAPTLYSIKVSDIRIADLSNGDNVRLILPEYLEHFKTLEVPTKPIFKWMHMNTLRYLQDTVRQDVVLRDLRDLFHGKMANEYQVPPAFIHGMGKWLKGNGFDGLSCREGGEPGDLIKWKPFMSYVIFSQELSRSPKEEIL